MIKCKNYSGSESNFQIAVANFLDYSNVIWCHTPNEIQAKPQYLKKRKKQGVKSGVPDISILEPRGVYHGFFIELKVGRNKPSEKQKEWIKNLSDRGYKTLISYSLDEVMHEVNEYLKLK